MAVKADKYLVGGVNSPVRSFGYVGGKPLLIERGKASKIYGHDGKVYIDYVLSFGAAILGHANKDVVKAVKEAAEKGSSFGMTTPGEIELAGIISKAIPLAEKIRFTNSGTEAVMGAIRLARAHTKRNKIIKFSGAYHGHADYLLAKAGSGLATMNIPMSEGVPADFIGHTLIAESGDKRSVDRLFKRYGKDIAAVIVEPVGGNYGVVEPDEDFLRYLRKITKKNGALLISDEVITAFRFRFGSVSEILGIKPDLICMGKIIGGGLPVGAYAGRGEIMERLAPVGRVYQASTFGGNPVVMSSGIAALKVLSSLKSRYKDLKDMTENIVGAINEGASRSGAGLETRHYGSMFSLKFHKKKEFQAFYKKLLSEGVFFAPSEYEANFLSFAHTRRDIKETVYAIQDAFKSS